MTNNFKIVAAAILSFDFDHTGLRKWATDTITYEGSSKIFFRRRWLFILKTFHATEQVDTKDFYDIDSYYGYLI